MVTATKENYCKQWKPTNVSVNSSLKKDFEPETWRMNWSYPSDGDFSFLELKSLIGAGP